MLALLIWRLFDKPDVGGPTTTVGIDWGIFVALLAAGALVAAGARVRAAGRPEPANPTPRSPSGRSRERAARASAAGNGRPREHTEVTQVLRERPPAWEGDAPEAPGAGGAAARGARPSRRAAARPAVLSAPPRG